MSDQDKKGGDRDVPKASAGGPGKVSSYIPHLTVQKNDILTSDVGGWWVCTAGHSTGPIFDLQPGQSNDRWHWSTGPSRGGA